MVETIILTIIAKLDNLNRVLADIQLDGMIVESVNPVQVNGRTRALIVFQAPLIGVEDPYDVLVRLEVEHADKNTIL